MRKTLIALVLVALAVPAALTLGNNPALLRLKDYIETNNPTEAQLRAASDAQWLAVMYPDSVDNAPYWDTPGDAWNWASPDLAKRYLRPWYEERRYNAMHKAAVRNAIEAKGWTLVSISQGAQVDGETTPGLDLVTIVVGVPQ